MNQKICAEIKFLPDFEKETDALIKVSAVGFSKDFFIEEDSAAIIFLKKLTKKL